VWCCITTHRRPLLFICGRYGIPGGDKEAAVPVTCNVRKQSR